jgi:hypothetical protein
MCGRHERGDYRLRRAGLFWLVERRWFDGWTHIGLPMRHVTAHAVLHELDDWQWQATDEARSVMRGDIRRLAGRRQPHGAE